MRTTEVDRLFGDPSSYMGYHQDFEYAPCNCPSRPCKQRDRWKQEQEEYEQRRFERLMELLEELEMADDPEYEPLIQAIRRGATVRDPLEIQP